MITCISRQDPGEICLLCARARAHACNTIIMHIMQNRLLFISSCDVYAPHMTVTRNLLSCCPYESMCRHDACWSEHFRIFRLPFDSGETLSGRLSYLAVHNAP